MRIVILCSSPFSETGCALAACVARLGYVPVGALTLPSWDRTTLLRKFGQWGLRDSLNYAVSKLAPARRTGGRQIRNPYLEKTLQNGNKIFRSLRDVARAYGFPVATCTDQNSRPAIEQLKEWAPDVAIFTGGNILRDEVLRVPRFGVLNSHLALLPEIRGMSSPEWSLLCGVPLGITVHFMDSGVDTGPVLLRREFAAAGHCDSLADLRNRMIAEGIDLIAETVAALDRHEISAILQADREKDFQYFVMHEQLKDMAKLHLKKMSSRNDGANPGPNTCARSAGAVSRHDE